MSDVFKDSKGRPWQLSLTFGDAKRVNRLIGVNLFTLVDKAPKQAQEDAEKEGASIDELPVFMQLQMNPILLGDVIYAIIKPQLDEKSVSDEEFSDAIGPKEFKEAKEIFWRLYHDFFLEAGETAKAKMVKGALRLAEGLDEQADKIGERIDEAIAGIAE